MHDALPTPIGLFDSGVGGLTVLKEIKRILPHESLIYVGDTARIPYGNKSPETIVRYSLEISHFLLQYQIKLLVVACNTASAHALLKLKASHNIAIVGVINPSAAKAVSLSQTQRIGIIGTRGTIQSKAYENAILQLQPTAQIITVACPLFVPIVEENFIHHAATQLVVKEYLKPLKEFEVDTLILGCTHYPLLKNIIQNEMGSHVILIDSAKSCAEEVVNVLGERKASSTDPIPIHQFFVSDDPENFKEQGKNLFDMDLGCVKKFQTI